MKVGEIVWDQCIWTDISDCTKLYTLREGERFYYQGRKYEVCCLEKSFDIYRILARMTDGNDNCRWSIAGTANVKRIIRVSA